MWLNAFLVKSGVTTQFIPRELINRHKLDEKKHCYMLLGAYCEVHDEPEITNTMRPRTHKAIAMGPTGNLQGSYKFLCLETEKNSQAQLD